MPSLLSVATVVAAISSLAYASPLDKRKTFSVNQVQKGQHLKNGPKAMAATYAKYNAAAPADVLVAAAAAASQQGSVVTTPESYDASYLSPVTVGGQTLMLDFDTGSADLWVFSTVTPSAQRSGHSLYNPSSSSSSSLKSGYKWKISYGDGSGASGTVYADKVQVGPVTATSQAVEAATSVSAQFTSDTDNDGLLGLAFSTINTVTPQQQTTFFDTVKSSLASPLFTATLKKGAPGTYDFGFIDSTKYTGNLVYTPVNTANGFWEFTSTGYAIGSATAVSYNIDGIADTGTTLLYLPSAVVTAYYAKVSGAKYDNTQGGYTFPCKSTLPSFSTVINGYKRTVPGSYINFAPISTTTCFGGIQPNTGIGFSIYGDIFLKSQFVVFDSAGPRLGFAQQAGVPAS